MKKLISLCLVFVSLFATLFCCTAVVSAVGETITLISLRTGTVETGKTKAFSLDVPAKSEVVISFFADYQEEYYDGCATSGDVKIQIKDSENNTVFLKEAMMRWSNTEYRVTLNKGKYKLTMTENSQAAGSKSKGESFEYYFKVTATLLEEFNPETVSLDKTKVNLSVGKTAALSVKCEPDGITIEPIWSSSNKKVAVVSDKGEVTAKALGSAKITVRLGTKKASCKVRVVSNNNAVSVFVGKSKSIQNKFANVSGKEKAKWSSSDKTIATVNSSGVVSGKTKGNVIITAKIGGVNYKQKVSVKSPSVTLSKTEATLHVGKKAKVFMDDYFLLTATTDPANQKVTWTSSNSKVATVSKKGVVKALKKGKATITVTTANNKKASIKITVK